jgi:hypothetical protein
VVDGKGAVLATVRRDSPTIDREAVVETIAAVANELVAQYDAPHRRHRHGRQHSADPRAGGPRQRKGPPPTGTGADLREGLEAHLTARVHRPANPVVVSSAGQEAGIIGTADLARQD